MNQRRPLVLERLIILAALAAAPAWADGIPDVVTDSADGAADEVRDDDSAFLESIGADEHDGSCSSDSQCFYCEACVNGYCTPQKPGGAGCTQYTPCGNGLLCLPSTVTPCATECVDTECATDADCGKCDYCQPWTGQCHQIFSGCKLDSDCGPQHTCQQHPQQPCLWQCVASMPQTDAVSTPDAAPWDADSGPMDTSAADVSLNDAGPKVDSGAPGDSAMPPDEQVGSSDALADAEPLDAAADATAKPAAKPNAANDGCHAGPAPASGAGWLLAAGLAGAVLRRRRVRQRGSVRSSAGCEFSNFLDV